MRTRLKLPVPPDCARATDAPVPVGDGPAVGACAGVAVGELTAVGVPVAAGPAPMVVTVVKGVAGVVIDVTGIDEALVTVEGGGLAAVADGGEVVVVVAGSLVVVVVVTAVEDVTIALVVVNCVVVVLGSVLGAVC